MPKGYDTSAGHGSNPAWREIRFETSGEGGKVLAPHRKDVSWHIAPFTTAAVRAASSLPLSCWGSLLRAWQCLARPAFRLIKRQPQRRLPTSLKRQTGDCAHLGSGHSRAGVLQCHPLRPDPLTLSVGRALAVMRHRQRAIAAHFSAAATLIKGQCRSTDNSCNEKISKPFHPVEMGILACKNKPGAAPC